MTEIPWREVYSIGVDSVDRQHRALLQEVAGVDQLISSHAPLEDLREAFDALHRHTEEHFRYEETLFDNTRFHRARQHKREHEALLLILRRFCQSLDTKRLAATPDEHIHFLRAWLLDHIRHEDYVLGIYLSSLEKR